MRIHATVAVVVLYCTVTVLTLMVGDAHLSACTRVPPSRTMSMVSGRQGSGEQVPANLFPRLFAVAWPVQPAHWRRVSEPVFVTSQESSSLRPPHEQS